MKKRGELKEKGLHPRNLHRGGYDFRALVAACPSFSSYVRVGRSGGETIDFADPVAVKALNAALLECCYGIEGWDIPDGFLCPPIPGRVDYLHYVADLLGEDGGANGDSVRMLDVGVGANGVYCLLAVMVYGWRCVGSDIDAVALENVARVASCNPRVEESLELRLQGDNAHVFEGVILEGERYDVSVCNPPFHGSLEEAVKGSVRKVENLARNRKGEVAEQSQNFGGQKAELWCKGGEIRCLRKMLKESKKFSAQCRWFTTLISKGENVQPCYKILRRLEAVEVREIEMKQGNKLTRVLAWRFC